MNTTTIMYHTKANGSKVYLRIEDEPKKAVIFSSILHQHLENSGIHLNHNDGRIDQVRELRKQQEESQSNETIEAQTDSATESSSSEQDEAPEKSQALGMLEDGSLTIKMTHESTTGSTTNMEVTDTPKNALAAVTLLMKYFEDKVT